MKKIDMRQLFHRIRSCHSFLLTSLIVFALVPGCSEESKSVSLRMNNQDSSPQTVPPTGSVPAPASRPVPASSQTSKLWGLLPGTKSNKSPLDFLGLDQVMKRDYFEFNNQRVREIILVVSNLEQVEEKEAARQYINSIIYQEVDKKYKIARDIAAKKTAENKKRAEAAAIKIEIDRIKAGPKDLFGNPIFIPWGSWYHYKRVRVG